MLTKPTDGYRPIGVFCAWYRVRGRLRRPHALSWEQQRPRRCWAAGAFRGASDVVWRQSVRAEAGTSRREISASVLTRLSLFAYRCGRFVSIAGLLGGPCFVDAIA
eukprot:637695-Pyramimonas_sp.AAC.1